MESSDLQGLSSRIMRSLGALVELIQEHQRFLLTTHRDPDGDGLGAEAALAAGLRQLGKTVAVLNNEATPVHYAFLDREGLFLRYEPSRHRDLIAASEVVILLDAGRPERTGRLSRGLARFTGPTVVLDHHPGGGWADIEIIEPEACSTTELVSLLLDGLDVGLTASMAEELLTGVLVDTDGFRNPNATPRAHRLAARLIEAGADTERVREAVFASWPLARLRLQADFLRSLHTRAHGRLIWGVLDRQALRRWRQNPAAVEGFVEYALTVRGTELSVLFLEEAAGVVRVSLRSRGRMRVDALARALGGGGHERAAGARVPGPLPRARRHVLTEAARLLSSSHGPGASNIR